jgi:hypothetical protein
LDPALLNESRYRLSNDFCGWINWDDSNQPFVRDIVFFILLQTDPMIDDQIDKNEAPFHISLSPLHIRNATLISNNNSFAGRTSWLINGTIYQSSFSRVECEIKRQRTPLDDQVIAWPWTNDTNSIVKGYADYNRYVVQRVSANKRPLSPPTPMEPFRFYQAYQVAMSTSNELSVTRWLSILIPAVQLSVVFLTIFIFLFILIVIGFLRYWTFWRKDKMT